MALLVGASQGESNRNHGTAQAPAARTRTLDGTLRDLFTPLYPAMPANHVQLAPFAAAARAASRFLLLSLPTGWGPPGAGAHSQGRDPTPRPARETGQVRRTMPMGQPQFGLGRSPTRADARLRSGHHHSL